jgi:hypothetical protein
VAPDCTILPHLGFTWFQDLGHHPKPTDLIFLPLHRCPHQGKWSSLSPYRLSEHRTSRLIKAAHPAYNIGHPHTAIFPTFCRHRLHSGSIRISGHRHSYHGKSFQTVLGFHHTGTKRIFTKDRESIHRTLVSIPGSGWTSKQFYTQYKLQRKNKLQKRKTTTKTKTYSSIPK